MKILVFGRGWLGQRIARDLSAGLSQADICNGREVAAAIEMYQPGVVVNAAGKTGRPNVDWCETHQRETYRANVLGPLNLAQICGATEIRLIHLGSGCVFYGRSAHSDGLWREGDHANPESFYSRTKYAADLVLSKLPHVAVVRLRMPIDDAPSPRNLITKLAGYKQVIDVENSVTVVADLVRVVGALAERKAAGVFHAVNPGAVRHRDILALYQRYVDPRHTCEIVPEEELVLRGLAVARRSNCVLADENLASLGISLRPSSEALEDAMCEYGKRLVGE